MCIPDSVVKVSVSEGEVDERPRALPQSAPSFDNESAARFCRCLMKEGCGESFISDLVMGSHLLAEVSLCSPPRSLRPSPGLR